jgi:glycosyltransferase involved in cell wall biosynthesis
VNFPRIPFLPKRPKTIVLDLRPLQCGYAGKGLGRYTLECARRIHAAAVLEAAAARPRYRVFSLVRADRDNPLPEIPVLIAAPPARRPWLWDQAMLPWLLIRHRVGLFHSFVALGPLAEVSFPAIYAFRCLATLHDWHMFAPDAPELDRHYRETLRIRIQKRSLPKVRRIIVDAEQIKVETILMVEGISAERIRVVPLGGDHLDALEPAFWLKENYALSVGDTPTKNLPLAFAALASLRARFVHLNWVIVGSRANVEARLALPPGEPFPPWITVVENPPDDVLKACYRNALCLLFPSLREGFGIPVLEAMRLGCPVLASDLEPLRSLLDYVPAMLPPGEPAPWADAIRNLLSFPAARQAHIAHGKERSKDFTWDKTARALIETYLT